MKLELDQGKWRINSAVTSIIELNAGPTFRARASTLKLHAALRACDAAAAEAVLAAPPFAVDYERRLRLNNGTMLPALHHVLRQGPALQWNGVARAMILGGANLDEDGGALDLCRDIRTAQLLI